ncbi:MAG: adenosylcobinamide-GDP ribazoletransferase [Rhodospirillaceae bacterium]|nr:adenosylcobinamide-GDP ribazoletransferase [Rhodospirillaceae bacterium]
MPKKIPSPKNNKNHNQSGAFAQVVAELYTVWIFFTRLPWPGDFWPGGAAGKIKPSIKLSSAARAFPFAGIVIGAIGAFVLFVSARAGLHPLASSILGLGAGMLASGAIHEDGLADVFDGFGGGANKTQKLEIMKDSRIGTYGMLSLVIITGLKASLLAGLPGPGLAAGALFVANVLPRAGLPLMMVALKPAKKSGLGHGAGVPKKEDAIISIIIGVLVSVLVLGLSVGISASVTAGLGLALMGYVAKRQIGGLSGDVLGGAEQIGESFVLLALAIMLANAF